MPITARQKEGTVAMLFGMQKSDGFLQKYCVVGLQENYLPQNVWMDFVNNPFFDCITYEDIFIHEKRTFHQSVAHAIGFYR